ncbi:hypothetical protein IMCC3317_43490 [Kordia antarctica]|uniref:Uncharacterized protein n=1 Tax=Kordia antarctica TaxID=1218801 RepID=A0A7L4ZR32_9FLAO|nr:hypothetical protein [Kordia antarctica]QHI38949.1 hypothetical protein IMCC3317_43490 [Kordia antarctica]
MSVPKTGTYAPLNKTLTITIESADPSDGQIQGTYVHNFTPEGPITVSGKVGGYAWVKNNDGGTGTAPFHINFTASVRPEGSPYCIVDFWNGFYTNDDTIVITGSRSYVKNDGTTQSIGLGTLELYLQS